MNNHKKIKFLIIAIIAIFAGLFFFILPKNDLIFLSPDEKSIFELSKEIKNDFKLDINSNQNLSKRLSEAVTLRDSANIEGTVVPQTFLGYLYLVGVGNLIHTKIGFFYMFIGFFLCLTYIYKLNTHIWGKKVGLITMLLGLSSTLLYFLYLGTIRSELIYVGFILMGIYYLIMSEGGTKESILIVSIISFSLAIHFRYINIVNIGLIALGRAYIYKLKKQDYVKLITIGILVFLPFLIQILLLSKSIYGDYFTTGYQINGERFSEILNEDKSLLEYNINVLLRHIKLYIRQYQGYIIIIAITGLFIVLNQKKLKKDEKVIILSIFVSLLLLLYFGGKEIWGHEKVWLNSSFLRYNILLILLLYGFVAKKILSIRFAILPIFLLLMIQFSNNTYNEYGSHISQNNEVYSEMKMINTRCEKNAPDGGYIFTFIADKFFYPCLKPIIQFYLIDNHTEIGRINEEYIRKKSLNKELFIETYMELSDKTNEDIYITSEVYKQNIFSLGLDLEKVAEFDNLIIYKIIGKS